VILRVRIFDAEIWWIDVMRDNFFIKALRRGAFVAVLAVPLYYFTSIESYDVWGWRCAVFVTAFFVYFLLVEFENSRSRRPPAPNDK
jgi:hypothetical protein